MRNNQVSANNSLAIVAAMMGRNFGVNVIMGDFPTASTDLKTIYIPRFDPSDTAQKAATFGFIVHECGHIRMQTDIDDFSSIRSERLRHLANILEDGRIERGISRIYKGAKSYLEGLTGFLIDKGNLPAAIKGDDPGKVLVLHIMHHISYKLLGYEVAKKEYEATAIAVAALFNQPFINRVNALLTAAVAAPDWFRVHEIAKELLKVMEDEAEAEQQRNAGAKPSNNQPSNGQDDQGDSQGAGSQGESQDDQGDNQGAGSQDESQDDQGDSQGAGSQGESQDDQGDNQGAGSQDESQDDQGDSQGAGSQGESQDDQGDQGDQGDNQGASSKSGKGAMTSALETLEEAMRPISDKGDAVSSHLVGSTSSNSEAGALNPVQEWSLPKMKGGALARTVKSYANTLSNQLKDLVSVETMAQSGYGRKGRRIESKRLCRIKQGDTRVFRTKNLREAEDTALFIALDMSDSMSEIMEDAAKCTLALSLAISDMPGVDLKVCGFSSRKPALLLKEFGEPMELATGRFDGLGTYGGTPMVPVVSNAALSLLSRPEPKRSFWMITDGDDYGQSDSLIQSLASMGIEAIGIYIGTKDERYVNPDAINTLMGRKFGKSWMWVENVAQLKGKLIKLAQESLISIK